MIPAMLVYYKKPFIIDENLDVCGWIRDTTLILLLNQRQHLYHTDTFIFACMFPFRLNAKYSKNTPPSTVMQECGAKRPRRVDRGRQTVGEARVYVCVYTLCTAGSILL